MAEIKSTMEMVLERAARMGSASPEEMESEQRQKAGMRLGADYVAGRLDDLGAALADVQADRELRGGLLKVLLRQVVLPRDEETDGFERVLKGFLVLGNGRQDLLPVLGEIQQLVEGYVSHRRELRQQLEAAISQQLEQMAAMQGGKSEYAGFGGRIDPKMHPKYNEEWTRLSTELSSQYGRALEQHKNYVASLLASG